MVISNQTQQHNSQDVDNNAVYDLLPIHKLSLFLPVFVKNSLNKDDPGENQEDYEVYHHHHRIKSTKLDTIYKNPLGAKIVTA